MSMTLVRKYFVDRCKALSLTEHKEPFTDDNIPMTLTSKAFQVTLGEFVGVKPINNRDQEMTCPVTVNIYVKGFSNPTDGVDLAIANAEKLMKECLSAKNRLGTCVKNVILNSVLPEALSSTNDNVIRVKLGFSVFTSILIDE